MNRDNLYHKYTKPSTKLTKKLAYSTDFPIKAGRLKSPKKDNKYPPTEVIAHPIKG